jgi:hypothetical protein
MKKTVEIPSQSEVSLTYSIEFEGWSDRLRLACNCEAGRRRQFCKHLVLAIHKLQTEVGGEGNEIVSLIVSSGVAKFFEELASLDKQAEELKAKQKRLKVQVMRVTDIQIGALQ